MGKINKVFLLLSLITMLGTTANAATINGETVTNAGNTEISGEDTLFEGNSNTSTGKPTIDNSKEINNKASNKTNNKSGNLSRLPETGPTETLLVLISFIITFTIFFKRRKK